MIFDDLDNYKRGNTLIKVIGVGGAGKNAINHMIENEVLGVEFYAVNTDAQDLKITKVASENRVLIGRTTTHGLGAGANPEIGRDAALESEDDIHAMIGEAKMVFITCGMGGGTGTGAAPLIAKVAREHNCLTVGVCTKPFAFEGPTRMQNAVVGLKKMSEYVDTLIVVPNQKLLSMVAPGTSILDAFREADNVLRQAVSGISEIIQIPSLINIDFNDVNTVMKNKGTALIGIGVAKGPNRAIEAARKAIHSPLLEVTIDGATDAIVNISADKSLSLAEVDAAIDEIRNNTGSVINIIFGTSINSDLKDELVVTVVATGYELKAQSNGFADLKDAIFRNMGNETISYEIKNDVNKANELFDNNDENASVNYPENNARLDEIFDEIDPKLKKKQDKEDRKAEKLARKQQKQQKIEKEEPKENNYPSWLRKK